MSKIPSIEIPSDSCAVAAGGEVYYPHAGESVWVWPDHSLEMYRVLGEFNGLQGRLAALKGEANEEIESLRLVNEAYGGLAALLAPSLDKWTWTDKRGQPMPALDGTPGPLLKLDVEEVQWLVAAVQEETPAARKNDLKPSRTTSSATA